MTLHIDGMATAAEIADAIRNALAQRATDGATGVVSVQIDGIQTTFSEPQARQALEYWEKRAARARRPMIRGIDLRDS